MSGVALGAHHAATETSLSTELARAEWSNRLENRNSLVEGTHTVLSASAHL